MEQKRVSFKVAQAIKEAGYPQEGEIGFSKFGEQITDKSLLDIIAYDPTYLDVWLWLWREKDIRITDITDVSIFISFPFEYRAYSRYLRIDSKGPEETIITAIEYLVDNNLIK